MCGQEYLPSKCSLSGSDFSSFTYTPLEPSTCDHIGRVAAAFSTLLCDGSWTTVCLAPPNPAQCKQWGPPEQEWNRLFSPWELFSQLGLLFGYNFTTVCHLNIYFTLKRYRIMSSYVFSNIFSILIWFTFSNIKSQNQSKAGVIKWGFDPLIWTLISTLEVVLWVEKEEQKKIKIPPPKHLKKSKRLNER